MKAEIFVDLNLTVRSPGIEIRVDRPYEVSDGSRSKWENELVMSAIRQALAALSALAALTSASSAQQQQAAPTTSAGWRAIAISDLDAARAILQSQTPIPYDTENPSYPAWLETGYQRARALAEQAGDASGHYYALAYYLNGFNDPHIALAPLRPLSARWPGFIAASRNGGAIVTLRDESDADAPPLGAQIISCDGNSLPALAEERVFPFVLHEGLALDRRRAVTRLFQDYAVPDAPAPSRCRFSIAGQEREFDLRWRAPPVPGEAYQAALQAAAIGPQATWGLSEPTPGVFWIGVPSFASGAETAPKLEHLLEAIRARGDALRNGHAIIIDVRGNGGGNSAWADRLAAAIFGDHIAARARSASTGQSAIDWRASPENAAYWENWINTVGIPEFGAASPNVRDQREVVRNLRAFSTAKPPIWRSGPRSTSPSGGLTRRRPRGDSPFPAHVFMLSNGTCASSCLDFADTVLFVPGVKLIGSATSGDGPYMEVRTIVLPSGLAQISIPQKVWRGMPRGPLEAYEPDIAYNGPWDDASVRSWVIGLIGSN